MTVNLSAFDQLMAHSIRPSVQRLAVMDYLLKYKNHPSVDEIYGELHSSIPTLSKTTIYNTLNLFLKYGAVQALTIDEKNVRYDADCSAHAHFRCRECGKLFDLPIPKINDDKVVPENFVVEECHVYYRGICDKCKGKKL